MFGIGSSEILIILLIALLVIGPSKLPEIARALGKGLAEFRRVSSDVKRQIDLEVQLADLERKKKEEVSTEEAKEPQGNLEGKQKESSKEKEDIEESEENKV